MSLPGVNLTLAESLMSSGYNRVKEIADAESDELASLTDLSAEDAAALIEQAEKMIAQREAKEQEPDEMQGNDEPETPDEDQ